MKSKGENVSFSCSWKVAFSWPDEAKNALKMATMRNKKGQGYKMCWQSMDCFLSIFMFVHSDWAAFIESDNKRGNKTTII